MRSYMEYKEFRIPEEITSKIEKGAEKGTPITLGDAGLLDWLTLMSKNEGWRPVWQTFVFPYVVMEREIQKS